MKSMKFLCRVTALLMISLLTCLFAEAQFPSVHAHEQPQKEVSFPQASQFSNTKLEYKIINAPNGTYGYDIMADGKLMIHQSSIPAMPGNNGFTSRQSAEKVALLVIQKIKKGEMPPTVSVDELKKLKVITK